MPHRLPHFTGIAAGMFFAAHAVSGSAGAQRASDLAGTWQGGIEEGGTRTEVTVNLYANGKYARRVVVSSEFGWTASGEVLLLAPAIGRNENDIVYGKPTAVRMEIADSVMTITDSTRSISLRRVTVPINESRILGRWEGQSELNEGITQDFLSDGRLIVTVTLAREAGRYYVRNKSIDWEVQIPMPRRLKSRFTLDADKLTLYWGRGVPETAMTRVRPP